MSTTESAIYHSAVCLSVSLIENRSLWQLFASLFDSGWWEQLNIFPPQLNLFATVSEQQSSKGRVDQRPFCDHVPFDVGK